eukprot:UN25598
MLSMNSVNYQNNSYQAVHSNSFGNGSVIPTTNLINSQNTFVPPMNMYSPNMQPSQWHVSTMNEVALNPTQWQAYTPCQYFPVVSSGQTVYQLLPVPIPSVSSTTSPSISTNLPTYSTSLSHTNSVSSYAESASSRSASPSSYSGSETTILPFQIYAAGKYAIISKPEFQRALTSLLKIYVHPSIEITEICDPTKPNKYKKNMINGVVICCTVDESRNIRAGFKPDLTQVQKKLENEFPLYSDISIFNEDPLDINRAKDKSNMREAYAHYNTDLLCNTEKINIGNFESSEDLNSFLDDLREVFYPFANQIQFLKVVYTKKKNVFKTFYVTSCFGRDAEKECRELHAALQKLGVDTYRSKSQKKQAQRRNFTM